jgi:CubicO group peptidase (beta-lactamase class C family)
MIEVEIQALLEDGVAGRVFPGAVALIGIGRSAPLCVATGTHTYDDDAPPTTSRTLFDVASLTKVFVTTTAILQLVGQQRLSLSDTVGKYLPRFRSGDQSGIILLHLLTHTSGLRADFELKKLGGDWGRVTQADLGEAIDHGTLLAPPGTSYLYSDLGFLLLGRIAELVTGSALDTYADAQIFGPLGMSRTRYRPPPAWWPDAAPTEYDAQWRGGLLQGRVHDEKAFLLGGVAGHAGLFSTAEDIHRFLQALRDCISQESEFVLPAPLALAMTQNQIPALPVRQGLGWFLDSAFLGDLRTDAFGHTGFTGVSVAVSPIRSVHCLLLTNCVTPLRPDKATRQRLNDIRAQLAGLALRMASESPKVERQEIPSPVDNKGA